MGLPGRLGFRGGQDRLLRGVVVVPAVLAGVVVACFSALSAELGGLVAGGEATVAGVLQAAGLLFFAFAGFACIAILGEEVRDPARTIPRAIPLAQGDRPGCLCSDCLSA